MSTEHKCGKCGAVLPVDAPKGLCPRCLMAAALAPQDEPTIRIEPEADEAVSDRIGRYKILQKLGEGGCGVVYMAEQTEPVRRKVALKVIKLGMDTRQVIARFEAERQALALMDHPNIAKVLDAGTTGTGRPYFVMELVKGIRITDYCDQNHLSTEKRLGLFTQVCQAIQHAHQKGIIHRDIKPSNILVTLHDGVPVPKVIDFGIAKATEQPLTEKTVFTAFGQFMGTPAYMSPEQAELSGLDIDTRSDIYALGVLLYELLTGRTPFDAKELLQAGLDEMRRRIREEEPMRPSTRLSTMADADLTEVAQQRHSEPAKLTRFIRGDLDWIVMKCLEKDRTRRYETANGLATDIRRHLENEPVVACPPSAGYRLQKMVRRNKLAVAAVSAVAAALVIGLGIAAWQYFEKSKAYNRAVAAEKRAEENAKAEESQRKQAEAAGEAAKRQEQLAQRNAEEARKQQRLASEQELLARRRYYAAQMNLANQAWETGQIPRTIDLLESQRPQPGQADLRGFVWFHLWGLCNERNRFTFRGHTRDVWSVAFSPDGRTMASAGAGGEIHLWDTDNGRELAVLSDGSALVDSLAFTPDGRTLVSGGWDGCVRLWDLATGGHKTLTSHPGFVRCVAVSPDGKTLASSGDGGAVKLWDLATGKERTRPEGHEASTLFIAFSPDNKTLAVLSGWGPDQSVVVWSLANDAPQFRRKAAISGDALAFSPDNRTVAIAGWDSVALLDTASGQKVADLKGHLAQVTSVAFLPDGSVASCGSDRTVRVWSLDSGSGTYSQGRVIGAHLDTALSVAASPNGVLLASGANDGSVKLWSLAAPESSLSTKFNFRDEPYVWVKLGSLQCSPKDDVAFVTTKFGTEVRDLVTARSLSYWPDAIGLGAVSPDGKLFASGSEDGLIKLWDAKSGRLLALAPHPVKSPNHLIALCFSPDGRKLVTGTFGDLVVNLWDVEKELALIRTIRPPPGVGITALQFTPDSKTLVAGVRHTVLCYFDVASGLLKESVPYGNGAVSAWVIAFSPDGKLMATSGDIAPMLWDAESKRPLFSLKGHVGTVNAIVFSPDGGTVATGGIDSTVRLWDVVTGQELITFKEDKAADHVAFSPDGNALLAASRDGTVWLRRGYHLPEADNESPTQSSSNLSSARDFNNSAWAIVRNPDTILQVARALALALEAVRLEPNNAAYLKTLGVAYFRNAEYERAIETLLHSGELNSGGLMAAEMFFLSMAHERLGQTTEAKDYYVRSLKWVETHSSKLSTNDIEELASFRVEAEAVLKIIPPGATENLLAARQPTVGDAPWDLYNKASLLRQQGELTKAEAVFHDTLAAMKKEFGPQDSRGNHYAQFFGEPTCSTRQVFRSSDAPSRGRGSCAEAATR